MKKTIIITLMLCLTLATLINPTQPTKAQEPITQTWTKTESTIKPDTITIRKLGIIDDKPVIYLYVHQNIQTMNRYNPETGESTIMYTYDMLQITVPAPEALEVDLEKIGHHSYNQENELKAARGMKSLIQSQIKELNTADVNTVTRRDHTARITDSLFINAKNIANVIAAK